MIGYKKGWYFEDEKTTSEKLADRHHKNSIPQMQMITNERPLRNAEKMVSTVIPAENYANPSKKQRTTFDILTAIFQLLSFRHSTFFSKNPRRSFSWI